MIFQYTNHANKKMKDEYTICKRCIMDNKADKSIIFDDDGNCNYCNFAIAQYGKQYFPNEEGKVLLDKLLTEVKKAGSGKKYDCIMGLSGGLDSSYLAYLGSKWGLRVLAVHIDDGYDTEISKNNLRKLVQKTGFDYEVIQPDTKQYNDLVLAYLKAGVPNIAVPQDNILFAFLYKKMKEYGIKYFLTGGNFALESILQKGNTHTAFDVVNIFDINKLFGRNSLDKLEFISTSQLRINRILKGIKTPRPLNYIDYNRDRAFKELSEFCDFQYYGRKHLENILTAFIQLYWLPKKFGVDKRKSHLSSMIISKQMTREDALVELKAPIYELELMDEYVNILLSKLNISKADFEDIMKAPVHQHNEYKTESNTMSYKFLKFIGFIK